MSGSLPPGQQAFNGQQILPGAVPLQYTLNEFQIPSAMNVPYQQARPLTSPQLYGQPLPPQPPHHSFNAQLPSTHLTHLPNAGVHMANSHQHRHVQQSPPPDRFPSMSTSQRLQYTGHHSHSPMMQQSNGLFHFQHNAMPVSTQVSAPMPMPVSAISPVPPVPTPLPSSMQFIPQQPPPPRFPQPQITIPSLSLSMFPNATTAQQTHQLHQPQQHSHPNSHQHPQFQQRPQQHLQHSPLLQQQQPPPQHQYLPPQQYTQQPRYTQGVHMTQPTGTHRQTSQSLETPSPQQVPQPFPPQVPPQPRQQAPITPNSLPTPLPKASPRASPKGAIQKTQKHPRKPSISGAMASPKVRQKRTPADAAALLVCVADDCFEKAQEAAPGLAKVKDEARLREYYKLLATGLGCLDTALRTHKFPPRVEVEVKIRYASILSEETENLMEAETSLQSALATCEKHRLLDLKLYVQFHFMKVLFRRKPKAALISIQTHIADCADRRQTYWTYAFRFLKAFFYLQAGNPAESHAIDNLHDITILADQRGDHAVFVLASLLQALALFRASESDVIERVQACMAAASKYQMEESVHIPQIDILWLLLDLACSFYQKEKAMGDKLTALQNRLEELKDPLLWARNSSELLLPLKKDMPSSHSISNDTADVLRPGDSSDYLVLNSFSKAMAFILGYTFSGLTLAPKQQNGDIKSIDFWLKTLKMIAQNASSKPASPVFLHEAVGAARWRACVTSYTLILMGLNSATHSDWEKVKDYIKQLENPLKEANDGPLDVLGLYLKGVARQGIGESEEALKIFNDPLFALETDVKAASGEGHIQQEVALLAGMNRLMIMQLHRYRDEAEINELVDQLNQLCASHPNPEIKTAYSLVMGAITTDPPLSMHDIKSHIQQGLNGSTSSGNAQCLNIALGTMRYRLFDNVVGDQALKSAKAGSAQAKKSGNILWMSVAEGMLAETYEVLGQTVQAQIARQGGIQYANESWERTQV